MSKIWHCGRFDIDTSVPQIMGIVNVTPDSFSDGGKYATQEKAIAHARELIAQGATIIDIGGESTRPGSVAPSLQEEINRVVPVIEGLQDCGAPLAVDTRHAAVARAAVEAGVDIINDIAGFRDSDMVQVAVDSDTGLVVMHMQGTPENMQQNPLYDDVAREIRTYLRSRAQELVRFGVDKERISLDPGFGFGKTYEHNLMLMAGVKRIVDLGYPVLIGISRKTFIGKLTGAEVPADRDDASAQLAVDLYYRGCSTMRVHNVVQTKRELERVSKTRHEAFIALGSNIGDKIQNLKSALDHISHIPKTVIMGCSHAYESEPAYEINQDTFANAVIKVETMLSPFALFAELQTIEHLMGRVKQSHNGPRSIDVDLLTFDSAIINEPTLVVPHPRIAERDFVVTPMLEIAPSITIAGKGTLDRRGIKYGAIIKQLDPICSERLMTSTQQKQRKQTASSKVDASTLQKLKNTTRSTKVFVSIGVLVALTCLFVATATFLWVTTPNYAVELKIIEQQPQISWFERQKLRWNLVHRPKAYNGENAVVDYVIPGADKTIIYTLSRQGDGGWAVDTTEQKDVQQQ